MLLQPAVTLLWLLNTLGQHPQLQEEICREVLEVCGTGEPVYSQLEDLRCVKMFIKETMRLYPTAPFLARIMPEDCTIGGYEVPKGVRTCVHNHTILFDGKCNIKFNFTATRCTVPVCIP